MSFVKLALRKYIKIPKLESFKNALFIGPHPDDIEFGAGATVSKMKECGAKIHFLIVTDGASGTKDKNESPLILKERREKEAIKAANIFGVDTIDFLNFEDGGTYEIEDLIKSIVPYVLKYNPDIIFTTDPDLKTECHLDHIKVGNATKYLTQIISYPHALKRHNIDISEYDNFPKNIFLAMYFTDSPNRRIKIKKRNYQMKEEAIYCHESQIDDSTKLLMIYFKAKAIETGITHLMAKAESFKVYHPVMCHAYMEGF